VIPGGDVDRFPRGVVAAVRPADWEARRRRRELRETETMDYAAFLRRVVRRYGERLADADYPDLSDAIEVREELDAAIRAGVQAQADRGSWASVALGLGMTRQGAWQRYGRTSSSENPRRSRSVSS
jgi:hypothetical protein